MHRKAERGNSIISEEAVCTGRLRGVIVSLVRKQCAQEG